MVKALRYKPAGRGFDTHGVIGIFHWHNPSGRTMALGSTQPLTEMSTRCISWGDKACRCVRLTNLPPSCAVVMKSGNLYFVEPSGPLQACNGTALPLPFTLNTRKVTSFPVAREDILKNSDRNTGHHTEIRNQLLPNKNPGVLKHLP